MKKSTLFKLIKSLSKSEKRYFRLFAQHHKNDNNFLLLFDAIDKQAVYNEEDIRIQFEGQVFIRQLHVTKNYLSRLILKSLRNYHSKASKEAEIHDLLRDAEILFEKELFDHCWQQLGKAEGLARQYEKQSLVLLVKGWQRRVLLAQAGTGKSFAALNPLIAQEKETLVHLNQYNQLFDLTVNLYDRINETEGGSVEIVLANPMLQTEAYPDSIHSQILFHYIRQACYYFSGDLRQANREVDAQIVLLEKRPELIRDNPSSYLTSINNKIGLCLHTKHYGYIPALLEKIRKIPTTSGLPGQSAFLIKPLLHTYNVELEMYRDLGNVEEGLALIEPVDAFLQAHSHKIPDDFHLLFHYQFAYLFFLKGDFKQALRRNNRILAGKFDSIRRDMLSYSRFLNLIIHYELGNLIVLRYAVESTRRFLRKRRKLQTFEKILLKLFSKLSTSPIAKHPGLFRNVSDKLFADDPNRRTEVLDYLDFEKWIEGKA